MRSTDGHGNRMAPEDVLFLLDVFYGCRVALTPDREHLDVQGPAAAVEAASPMLRLRKPELVAHLRSLTERTGVA